MSQCTDVDAALKRLGEKVDAQNKVIDNLRNQLNQCCGDKNKQQNNKPYNDSELRRRINSLELQTANHRDVLESLNAGIKAFGDAIKKFLDLIKFFFTGIEDVDS